MTRNWIASRIFREKYGETTPNVAIHVGAISGALAEARQRVLIGAKVETLPSPPMPDRVEYCDLDATSAAPVFNDPLERQGDSVATRPDKVSRDLAEMVRLPTTLGDALD